jgi:hypothetical protein
LLFTERPDTKVNLEQLMHDAVRQVYAEEEKRVKNEYTEIVYLLYLRKKSYIFMTSEERM